MPQYGAFQTDRLLLRAGRESFWIARDASGAACTLHVLEPPEVWDEQHRALVVKEFLDRAALQQKMARECGALAEVRTTGSQEHFAFATLEPAAESLARLISFKPKLTTASLRRFTLRMVESLLALKKAGHPHGALSAGSVLLSSPHFEIARPLLVHPNPNARTDHDDMPALGRILFLLIQQREFSEHTGIGTDETWRGIPEGNRWKHLIMGMLALEEGMTLETVARHVPAPSRRNGKPAIIAAVLLLAVGAWTVGHFMKRHTTTPPPPSGITAAALDALAAANPSGPFADSEPTARLLGAIKALSEEQEPKSEKGLVVVNTNMAIINGCLDEIARQITELHTSYEALPNKTDYANFPDFLARLDSLLASARDAKTAMNIFVLRAAQFAVISNDLKFLQHKLAIPDAPPVIQQAFYAVVNPVVPDAENLKIEKLMANLKDQPFIRAENIAAKKDSIAWNTIPASDFPPGTDGLASLEARLLDFSKVSPDELIAQVREMRNDISNKVAVLTKEGPNLPPELKEACAALTPDYERLSTEISTQFDPAKAQKGGVFDASNSQKPLYWISRDYKAIQAILSAKQAAKTANDNTYDDIFGLKLKDWIVKFKSAAPLNTAYLAYYDKNVSAYPGDDAPRNNQLAWKLAFQKASLAATDEFNGAQRDAKTLYGKLPTASTGLEQTVVDILKNKLSKIDGQLSAMFSTFDPVAVADTKTRLHTVENELGGLVNVKIVAAGLGAATLDPAAIEKSVAGLTPFEGDVDFKPVMDPIGQFSTGINGLAKSGTRKEFTEYFALASSVKIPGVPPNAEAVSTVLWNRISELKTPDQDLMKYTLEQVPAAGMADPAALAAFLATHITTDLQPNLMLEAFLPVAIKNNDATVTDALATELGKLNAPAANARLTRIIASLKVDPKATMTIGAGDPMLTKLPGWKATHDVAAATWTFNFTNPMPAGLAAKAPKLTFRQVAGTQTYLCTTEAPLALLATLNSDQRAALHAKQDLAAFDVQFKPGIITQVTGVVGFQDDDKIVSTYWGTGNQPEGVVKPWSTSSPTVDHPIQFVTPAVAAYIALKTGCRLPTITDWKGADGMNSKVAGYEAGANVTGPAWDAYLKAYQTSFVDTGAQTGLLNPINLSAGIFEPKTPPAGWVKGAMANPAKPWPGATNEEKQNLANVLFRPVTVDAAVPFLNLIGNVGEFAFDPALTKTLDALKLPDDPTAAVDQINAEIAKNPALVTVIGGSCLAPMGKIANAREALPISDPNKAYTDVGLRLAFDGGMTLTKSVALQVSENLKQAGVPSDDLVWTMAKP